MAQPQLFGSSFRHLSVDERALTMVVILLIGLHIYLGVSYADQPLLELHGFRQTQTALTAFWMKNEGFRLAYQTPIAGAPWEIPFEFPFYQGCAAILSSLAGLDLDKSGRLLSGVFLLAGIVPVMAVGARLGAGVLPTAAFLCLWLSSPLYLFWGRSFMIETAALFFVLAALPFCIDLIRGNQSVRTALFAGILLCLALLQKITTALIPLLLLGACWLTAYMERSRRMPGLRALMPPFVAFVLPLLVAGAWTHYTDVVKSANALGSQFTSEALKAWNFGTLAQRAMPQFLHDVLWQRSFVENLGGYGGLLFIVAALFKTGDARLRRWLYVCVAMFLLPLLTFSNLHIVHRYYQVATTVFGTAAFALAVSIWAPSMLRRPGMASILIIAFVANNLMQFHSGYWRLVTSRILPSESVELTVASILRENTPADSAFVTFGNDWSSTLAYYAQRKSFGVPDVFRHYDQAWQNPRQYLGGMKLGGVVLCRPTRGPSQDQLRQALQKEKVWGTAEVGGCTIFLVRDDRG